jgi:hypothetical protein
MAVRTATGSKADWAPDVAGVPGAYTNIPEVRVWNISPSTETKEYASSSTAGAKRRISSTDDFDGSIEVYVDDSNRFDAGTLDIMRGEIGWLKLYEDDTTFHIAAVFIDSVDYEADIEGGEILAATINFSANGAWTPPT